jgi:hypothetical protein
MSWHYLPELVADYWQAECSAGEPSAPWKSSRIVERCSFAASGTVCFPCSQFGTTLEPFTVSSGVERWILSLRDSRASRLALQESNKAYPTNGTCGLTPFGLLEKLTPDSYFWKTCQVSFLSGMDTLQQFLDSFPTKGSMRDGKLFQQQKSAPHIIDQDSLCWPTPRAHLGTDPLCGGSGSRKKAEKHGTRISGAVDPRLLERLMGWPTGWTALEPLETESCRNKCVKRGEDSQAKEAK